MSEDLDDLTHALARAAEAVCRHYLSHGVRRGRYWLVGDIRNTPGRSLYVRLAGAQFGKGAIGKWRDMATAEYGDLLDIIRERSGLRDFGDVVREARQFLNLPRPKPSPTDERASLWTPRDSAHSARRLFAASRPIYGTLAEAYLRERGVTDIGDLASLRFHSRCFYRADADSPKQSLPAMIAAVTDLDGAIAGVQRTWLDPSGHGKAAIETPRRAMGDLLGNAVRFGEALDCLAAGEGVETMLSLRSVMPILPTMAALSAANLAAILFPESLRRLYVARDNDPAGKRAAARLVDRANAVGIEAIVLSPSLKDFNDDLRALGVEVMRVLLRTQVAKEDVARFIDSAK